MSRVSPRRRPTDARLTAGARKRSTRSGRERRDRRFRPGLAPVRVRGERLAVDRHRQRARAWVRRARPRQRAGRAPGGSRRPRRASSRPSARRPTGMRRSGRASSWRGSTPPRRPRRRAPARFRSSSARTTARRARRSSSASCLPAASPWHYHQYDEIVWIPEGPGRLHLGDDVEELASRAPRSGCGRARCTSSRTRAADRELTIVGVFTPAGSPAAAYLEPDVAAEYRFEPS